MNNKRKDKDPLFAEVKLTGEEFNQYPINYAQRARFLKLVYPNNVTLLCLYCYACRDGRNDSRRVRFRHRAR